MARLYLSTAIFQQLSAYLTTAGGYLTFTVRILRGVSCLIPPTIFYWLADASHLPSISVGVYVSFNIFQRLVDTSTLPSVPVVVYFAISFSGWPEVPKNTRSPIFASWGFVTLCGNSVQTKKAVQVTLTKAERVAASSAAAAAETTAETAASQKITRP